MNMADWLRSLGLERYEQAFRENRIEADVLPSLTVEDLKDLGVTLVGDRRRLLDAIAALGPLPFPPPHAGEGRVGGWVRGRAPPPPPPGEEVLQTLLSSEPDAMLEDQVRTARISGEP